MSTKLLLEAARTKAALAARLLEAPAQVTVTIAERDDEIVRGES